MYIFSFQAFELWRVFCPDAVSESQLATFQALSGHNG